MFTGIVEEIGVVAELNPSDATGGTSLTITLPPDSTLLSDAHLGDSIAINGVCLTVTSFNNTSSSTPASAPQFTVGIAPETLRLTNLGSLAPQSRVNLERAVRADTRMGGHFVQGHVDTTAEIVDRRPDGNAVTMRFAPRSKEVLRYVVYKGFIALDGASLTVTHVNDDEGWWEVMLIAYTQERIVTAAKQVGDTVNVEVDMTAKYVEKSLQGYLAGLGAESGGAIPLLQKMVETAVAKRSA
ncbi:riboflavin synthase-like protein [Canariomyces notabilis]|uniref:Riboflavin synthase n=1 Tax=Canariomyces notabilis TaxID=2074819 RepID=A0AAN6TD32_9PEZI|nr:riboflavin synthase-like protein [Canariomyces arenarius]